MTPPTLPADQKQGVFEKVFLFGLFTPLAILILILKKLRILYREEIYGWTHSLDLYKSELLFVIAFGAFGLFLLGCFKKRYLPFILLQCITAAILLTEITAHQFHMSTGAVLDFHLIYLAISELSETWQVIQSEVSSDMLFAMTVFTAGIIITPWIFIRPRISINTPEPTHTKTHAILYFSLAFTAFTIASTPPFIEPHIAFSRAAIINITLPLTKPKTRIHGHDSQRPPLTNIKLKERPEHQKNKNVAIIILESVRTRSTSVYNDSLNTTPFLQEIAQKSLVAENAYSIVPHTSKALVSILCGIEPELNMKIVEAAPNGIPTRCLAELLEEHGYQTAFFQAATEFFEGRRQLIKNMGYQFFLPVDEMSTAGFGSVNYFGYEDDVMLEPSKAWLSKQKNKPFLTTYLTVIPHHDYTLPDDYQQKPFTKEEPYNHYLNAINYLDSFVEKLLDQYKSLGIYEDTIFIFVGDHGEGFGEHYRYQHDNIVYEEGIHVPLIMHDPSNPQHTNITAPASQIDILPTLANMLNFDLIEGQLPGFSLSEIPEDRRLFAKCWYRQRCMATLKEKKKYIHHFHDRPDEFFDLTNDPLESNNLASTQKERLKDIYQELADWHVSVTGMYERNPRKDAKK